MGQPHKSRSGSMQYWPRKRARRQTPRVRHWPHSSEKTLLGFAGYKVGMTHVMYADPKKASKAIAEEVFCPVTVIECPPLKVAAIRLYKEGYTGKQVVKEINLAVDKELSRRKPLAKQTPVVDLAALSTDGICDIRVLVYTQPKGISFGKKIPDVFEIGIGGTVADQLAWVREHAGKELLVEQVFKPGQIIDATAVTRGKGLQGPVKRFGVSLRRHKSEKTKRGPGSLGAWCGQGHMMYRVAHAGQMGYHLRTEYNKWIVSLGKNPEVVNKKGGFFHYGPVKYSYLLVKGSIQGSAKRLIMLTVPRRANKQKMITAPQITYTQL